ncbi:MAG: hypothetical protein EBR30_11235 [Cytophagia bacterium]|nr:hypothetical protein [Cytophagia bacterium]NBW35569.1 hypothetical protein [Cytophagia bacterium]
MKIIVTIILTYFISLSAIAQDNVELKEMVGFGCYLGGQPTKTVLKVEKLLASKNYEGISKLLTSRNSGEKYLAVISLQRLSDIGKYNLSEIEKELFSKAKESDEMVSVCSGCTYFDKVPMKTILSQDDFLGSNYWLDRILKGK